MKKITLFILQFHDRNSNFTTTSIQHGHTSLSH